FRSKVMNPKFTPFLLCTLLTALGFFVANHLVIGMQFNPIVVSLIGVMIGATFAYKTIFNTPNPTPVKYLWDPVFTGAVLGFLCTFFHLAGTTRQVDWVKIFSVTASLALVGLAGGLSLLLGFNIVKERR